MYDTYLLRYRIILRNFAAFSSLAYISANLAYFEATNSVSICAKLARSILMRDRNTATEPNFRKSLSKKLLSPKNTYLLISDFTDSKLQLPRSINN